MGVVKVIVSSTAFLTGKEAVVTGEAATAVVAAYSCHARDSTYAWSYYRENAAVVSLSI